MYDRHRVSTCPGEEIQNVYGTEYNKNKQLTVVKKGQKDTRAYINSFADSVDIHVLLQRFAAGDKEALLQREGAYLDISSLPTNINDFIDLARKAEDTFNALPIETKKEFNNNLVEFMSTIGDDSWLEKMKKSRDEINRSKIDAANEATKAAKDAAKVQFNNSVYGDDYVETSEVTEVPKADINPITGNETRKR